MTTTSPLNIGGFGKIGGMIIGNRSARQSTTATCPIMSNLPTRGAEMAARAASAATTIYVQVSGVDRLANTRWRSVVLDVCRQVPAEHVGFC